MTVLSPLGLADLAAARAAETEEGRRLAPELVEALRDAGCFRLGVPEALGGPQGTPAEILACAEEIARGDMSAGWCVSIAATSSLLAAHLPPAGAREVFGPPGAIAAGVWAPTGRAVPAPGGGLRVTGRWAFCSGIDHADWLLAGCVTEDEQPAMRIVALPRAELEVLDTWHVGGLRGTGSHDAVADGVAVPAERVLSLLDGGPVVDAPLYRFPIFGFFALSIAAAALGNARGALDDLAALAAVRHPHGARRTMAQRPDTQARVAEAEAALRAARALVTQAVWEAWAAATAGGPVGDAERLGLRLAATHAVRTSARVADAMHDLAGGAAVYDRSPLGRRFRDAHAATAHVQVAPITWETTGRLLLGLPDDTTLL
ncbi:hydroxylase [Baekduia soli]|uniref:Hydroxylase n=1 Tax=Baekduia soli TaxID=496014 RepID=A0A5B8UA06_9ACTN|nr:acyl-CoA dehydrogenase family protein [Baekduia soli]QEC49451.1 hydroxylase [Baekduia soli]